MSGERRKKIPACDYCKAHRVLCYPQADGTACPRCKVKNIQCTTTPVTRRKRRTKEELLKVASALSGNVPPQPEPSTASVASPVNTGAHTLVVHPRNSAFSEPEPVPPSLELPVEIVQDLFQTFCRSPLPTHPTIQVSKLGTIFRLYSWNIRAIPSPDRALIHCIIAYASLLSTNPFIIGPADLETDQFHILTVGLPLKTPTVPDLRPFGFRRESIFRQLWAEALWVANLDGVATRTSKDNAAACWVLSILSHMVLGQGTSAFRSAFIYHIRTLVEATPLYEATEILRYHGYMLVEVLDALASGRNIPYTPSDEDLLVPFTPKPLEQLIDGSLASLKLKPYRFSPSLIHQFASHAIRLARTASDNLTGVAARRRPLNEGFLIQHLATLDVFHSYLIAELGRINMAIESMASLQPEPKTVSYLRHCTHGFVTSWAALIFPVFQVIRDRSIDSLNSFSNRSSLIGTADPDSYLADELYNERLQMHYRHVRKLTTRTALELKDALRNVPIFQKLVEYGEFHLVKWAMFLVDEFDSVDITREQRLDALVCFRDALQLCGFSYADRTGIVDRLNEHIASYSLDDTLLASSRHPSFGVDSYW
ncbi:hypothetical protein BDP27DRAFT_1419842 [Rhodocollybia butyracea]|uniref:Zn(2)-C6 fungal-type domain-containing protein n=1 Tax=Rhodocollybia butyracea TaxID=206335 RepID=A0A9P5PWL4_9AGAR|nr:hypothetical protein BDP27DRAFT_1419842 [Rhodocollybia butyracea]